MDEKEFPCAQEGLIAAQQFLSSVCDAPKPAVILDEIASNIVRCSGAKSFSLGIERTEEGLRLRFSDDGSPFDPLKNSPEVNVRASADDRPIGGLGIFMVRKMSKALAYERREERNILTVLV